MKTPTLTFNLTTKAVAVALFLFFFFFHSQSTFIYSSTRTTQEKERIFKKKNIPKQFLPENKFETSYGPK